MPSNTSVPTRSSAAGVAPTGPRHPGVEYYNVADLTKTDARGFVRSLDRCHAEPWGLYVVRPSDTPPNRYTETWLLPEPSIRVSMDHVGAAHDRNPVYHVYFGEYLRIEPKRWKAAYNFLELTVHNGDAPELHGVDQLLAAHAAGYLDTASARRAIEHAIATIDGIASYDHNVERWLRARGIALSWL